MEEFNELALFAGVGGGLLATKWMLRWRTVCYVEWEQYCIDVLTQRIADGLLDDAPIWDDARTFNGAPWRGCVDIITAGFPCQPFSVAGHQQAERDERNMWPDTIRIIREVKPPFVLLENVPGLLAGSHGYFGQILTELAESGYNARWRVLSAAEVGAPHKRDRLFIVAHTKGRQWGESQARNRGQMLARGCTQGGQCDLWQTEPAVDRVVDGLAYGVDRLKAIGNGQVSLVVATVWRLLSGK